MAEKSFQKKKVRLYAATLSFLIVAFSFCPILRVYADWDPSAVAISVSDFSISLSVDSSTTIDTEYVSGGDPVLVSFSIPLYMNLTINNSNITRLNYLSGYYLINNNILSGFSYNVDGILPNYEYFEPVYNGGAYLGRIDTSSSAILFNNFMLTKTTNATGAVRVLLGYMHFNVLVSRTNAVMLFTTSSVNTTSNSTVNLYATNSEYGLVNAVVYAIDHSTDVEDILDILTSLDNATLQQVIPNLQNLNGILGNIYNYMNTMNNTQLNSMRQLVYALSGVDLSTTSSSALATATYNRWVQLIYDAINYQGPDSSAADQAADNLEDAHEANDLAQDSAYQAADTAMQNVNFNVTVPNGLTNAALTIGNYITSIYGQLGSDLQFLITATLTIGLITVILGVINRYPKNTYTTESETVSTGERNGKKFSSSYKTTTKRTRHR